MDITGLYGTKADSTQVTRRFDDLRSQHQQLFSKKPEAVFSTAGRTELGGNHTDHNLGKVLAGAISLDTIAAVSLRKDSKIRFISEGYEPIEIDLPDSKDTEALMVHEEEKGHTKALIRGVASSMVKRGGRIGGFDANVSSTVLRGSGLSSSASVEVLLGTIFNSLFNHGRFSTTEIAEIGQEAENVFFGKPCGLMDQIACATGGIVGIDFKESRNPVITPVDVDFAKHGYDLVIVNTGSSHDNLTDHFAAIPAEMKTVAAFFGAEVLREVKPEEFFGKLPEIRQRLSNDRAVLRAMHYFEENSRVDRMIDALEDNDFKQYLALVNETGLWSFKYLQNIYNPSDCRSQGISLAYALTERFLKDQGAFRVQGGGFAGTVEAYIPQDRTQDYCKEMEKVFGRESTTVLGIRKLPTMRID